MPGWHERTKEARESGALQVVGIVQEQHPARAALFMQWKQMDWPIMVDSLDLLGVAVVPITLLIDEAGIVRSTRPRGDDLRAFLESESAAPSPDASTPVAAPATALTGAHQDVMFGGRAELERAIATYAKHMDGDDTGATHFRLGVALRRRYESDQRRDGDFASAIGHWREALAMSPNQYIWRRRIQQYGPRLDKPYPFYDWIAEARQAIETRGATPVPLPVEPRGAELAAALRRFSADDALESPDPEGRVDRDAGLVDTEVVIVPHTSRDGVVRVHVTFRPRHAAKAHWNNEAEDMVVWFEPPAGWSIDQRRHVVTNPTTATSRETRHVEVELRRDENAGGGPAVSGYALYNVCEGAEGACLYRRQDLRIPLQNMAGKD